MEFTEALDRLVARPTHRDVAQAAGASLQAVRQARLDASSRSYRRPPPGWEAAVAKLARKYGAALLSLADQLEEE